MYSYNFDNNYLLLNFTISVHVFHKKDTFTNFKRVTKDHKLLCSTKIIIIKEWEEILLPLKIKNQILILILKEVAYIPNFSFNLISLDCLKDREYR